MQSMQWLIHYCCLYWYRLSFFFQHQEWSLPICCGYQRIQHSSSRWGYQVNYKLIFIIFVITWQCLLHLSSLPPTCTPPVALFVHIWLNPLHSQEARCYLQPWYIRLDACTQHPGGAASEPPSPWGVCPVPGWDRLDCPVPGGVLWGGDWSCAGGGYQKKVSDNGWWYLLLQSGMNAQFGNLTKLKCNKANIANANFLILSKNQK